ncbi:sorting nexin-29 [Diachasmimorpha longicaudata]|uniref:sorting nexin-29 n=1 Tax=Diachasmimorpha longicaudata TaxID=58733 RepID=UPI0030B8BC90
MALRMMSAIVPSPSDLPPEVNHPGDREKLQEELLAAAKCCHVRFGGRMELATESDQCVSRLCHSFEAIFRHGLKTKGIDKLNLALRHVSDLVSGTSKTSPDPAFWPCIKEQLTWHEQERFSILKKVHTDFGRGRAWLRAALNERSLERHLHSIINSDTLSPFYEEWSFLLDQERSQVLPNVAAGLGTIVFAIRIDNEDLDDRSWSSDRRNGTSQSEPIISSSVINNPEGSGRSKRRIPTHIISFDDEIESDNDSITGCVSLSAPPTCLNSPGPDNQFSGSDPVGVVAPGDAADRVQHQKTSSPGNLSTSMVSPSSGTGGEHHQDQTTSSGASVPLDTSKISSSSTPSPGKIREIGESEGVSSPGPPGDPQDDRVLTPLTDVGSLGGLLPVSPLDQTLDDFVSSNYLESLQESLKSDLLDPEPAIEATEPLGLDPHLDPGELDVESLRTRLLAMGEVLENCREDAITSRVQLARLQRQHQNYLERHELQVQALNRENELLRQQLRKYVTAVQMLRRDSDSVQEGSEEDGERGLDYHFEAQQYQEKLVQVAEMHAELMEFNNRLTMQLGHRENLVKRLQAELECLRGPLNDSYEEGEGEGCLIHIWIPSAFLTGQSSDVHHVYQIYVRIRDIEWNIYRRYAQFHTLHRDLKKHDAIVTTFEFPPKKTIGNKDAKFVENRRQKLQQWLRRVVGRLAQCSPAFIMRPSKQTLISLMPFFGDHPNEDSKKSNSVRNNFSSSPQYMGL